MISYVQTTGLSDYHLEYNDFTVEFFAEPTSNVSTQTLFEISNNLPLSNTSSKTLLIALMEFGDLNLYGINTTTQILGANVSNINVGSIDITKTKLFQNGNLLSTSQYSYTSGNITLTNSSSNISTIDIGTIVFEIGNVPLPVNSPSFISAERCNGIFYLSIDGSMIGAANSNIAIPSTITSTAQVTIGANKDGYNPFIGKFGDFRVTNGISRYVNAAIQQSSISSSFTDSNIGIRAADIVIDGSAFVDNYSSHTTEELIGSQINDAVDIRVYQNSNCSYLSANVANVTAIITSVTNPAFNAATPSLGFRLFKNSLSYGPIRMVTIDTTTPTDISISFDGGVPVVYDDTTLDNYSLGNISTANVVNNFPMPWSTVNPSDASVIINGNVIDSSSWVINNYILALNNNYPSSNVTVINTGLTQYYAIAANAVTTLSQPLLQTDSTISLANTTGFITPIPSLNNRGKIFIENECITYLYIDRTNHVISGIMRGVDGTGVPTIHNLGVQVMGASSNETIPNNPGEHWWYNTANTTLINTNSNISNFLVSEGTVAPL